MAISKCVQVIWGSLCMWQDVKQFAENKQNMNDNCCDVKLIVGGSNILKHEHLHLIVFTQFF